MPPKKKSSSSPKFKDLIIFPVIIFGIYLLYILYDYYLDQKAELHSFKAFQTWVPKGYEIYGIDVSKYQNHISWKKVSQAVQEGIKIKFVFLKTTEGTYIIDKTYFSSVKKAREAGLRVGSYHFYRPRVSSAVQANHFLRFASIKDSDLPPVVDIELSNGQTSENIKKGLANWLRIVEEECNKKPIIYTNPTFYEKYLKNDFDDYKIWVAHYQNTKKPRLDRDWTFWQFTEEARVSGIGTKVDLNVFNGTEEEFREL